ncbi:LuxR C-terminal-related transcriptional regulator [Micromonospora sp. NPDC049282]|uniref:helix-turn-helix transcriptional regulator n=1 Tax=Micromonospora sp. NPDC049282 TaxID=3364269 RepID=UPI00371F8F9A
MKLITGKDEESERPDDSLLAAYRCCLNSGSFEAATVASVLQITEAEAGDLADRMESLGLLTRGEDEIREPVDPDVADMALNGPLEREILERQMAVQRIRDELKALRPIYDQLRRDTTAAGAGFRELTNTDETVNEIAASSRRCVREVLSAQPGGGRGASTLADALPRDLAALERGVGMRVIYQHTARTSLATRAYVSRIQDAGGVVRTTDDPVERMVIFDRAVAFVSRYDDEGNRLPGGIRISVPACVRFLAAQFDKAWLTSVPFDSDTDVTPEMNDVRLDVLRLMALGLKDEVIARRLGMATRTCRRYIALVMQDLGVESRFQAGAKAALLGLLPETVAPSGPTPEPRRGADDARPA